MPPDAPAAPAAAPAAPSTPAPGGGTSAGATPAGAPTSSGGAAPAPKAPWGDGPLRVPLKLNGREEVGEYGSVEDLQRELQQARLVGQVGKERKALEQRLAAAEEQRKADEEALKRDPFGWLATRGLDVDGYVKQRILENARRAQLPADQLAAEEARRASEPLQKQLTEAQKRIQAFEAQAKAARLEQWAAEEWGRLEPQFLEAAKTAGIEMDEGFLQDIADEAESWLEAGLPIDPGTIFKSVNERTDKRFWGRLNTQKPAAVYAKLSPELRQAIVQMAVEDFRKARSPANPNAATPPAPLPAKSDEPRKYIDLNEFKRAIR